MKSGQGFYLFGSAEIWGADGAGPYHIKTAGGAVDAEGLNLITDNPETAQVVAEAMGKPAIVVSDGDSLGDVASAVKNTFPRARILICGDLSAKGKAEAVEAARLARADFALPDFGPAYDRAPDEISFAHLASAHGIGAVRDCIEGAKSAEEWQDREDAPLGDLVDKAMAVAENLAGLSSAAYDHRRLGEAKALKIRVTTLDKLVREARTRQKAAAKTPPTVKATAPADLWPQAVDGETLLGELTNILRTHVFLTGEQALAAALWVLFAHSHDCWQTSPNLAVQSPVPECGKTTTLKVLKHLVPNPLMLSGASPAGFYRMVADPDAPQHTWIFDEGDSFLKNNETFRGILNSGHDRAFFSRGSGNGAKIYNTWCPKIFGLIGALPSTLQSRSIVLTLRRKLAEEQIVSLNGRMQEIKNAGRRAARWVADNLEKLREQEPSLPEELSNRLGNNWFAPLAIADVIGGEFPEMAREAASVLSSKQEEPHEGLALLAAIREIWGTGKALGSKELAARLPNQISAKALALKTFGIFAKMESKGPHKGRMFYYRADFEDAFQRYAPKTPPDALPSSTRLKRKGNLASETLLITADGRASKGRNSSEINAVEDSRG